MKMTKILLFSATVVATLATNQFVRADNLAAEAALASDAVKRPIMASPHALEEFTWLTRQSPTRPTMARTDSVLASIKKNRALAASPRVREEFPTLDRGEPSATLTPAKPVVSLSEFNRVTKNRALATSPRAKEEYPWLARGYTPQSDKDSFEVAPLK